MKLPSELLDEFAKVTHDPQEKKENTIFYGVAKFTSDGDFVLIDGATTPTPATYATSAVNGDRVMGTIKNHKAVITANITNPSMTLGILRSISGIIVEGYLTTNAERVRYNDQTKTGLTFSNGGMGAYGGQGRYWYITNDGDFRAEKAYVKGTISASSGYIGSETNGFKIDEFGIYSGADKTGASTGFITLGNVDFTRAIGGDNKLLRFAIGGNFGVSANGVLYAHDAEIIGTIEARAGKIGNFSINGALYSNNKNEFNSYNSGVYLGTDGIALGEGNKFTVSEAGVLTAKEANIEGVLTANAGSQIGPWKVASTAIYKGTTDPLFNNVSSLYFGDSGLSIKQSFVVDSNGSLTAKAGTIGNWAIGNSTDALNGSLYTTGKSLGDSGSIFLIPLGVTGNTTIGGTQRNDWVIGCGSKFGVTKNGDVYGSSINVSAGSIGGFVVDATSIHTNGVAVTSNASNSVALSSSTFTRTIGSTSRSSLKLAIGSGFGVSNSGVLYANGAIISGTITATSLTATTSGKIGPWSIGSSALYMTSATHGASNGVYLGTAGFSVKDVFIVDSNGYLTIKPTSGSAGITVGGTSDNYQHTQLSDTFVYVGNNATERLVLTRGSIRYATGTYANPLNSNTYIASKFSFSTGVGAWMLPRTYNNEFLVPVGSTTETNRKVATLRGRGSHLEAYLQANTSSYAWVSLAFDSSDVRLKENITSTEVQDALSVVKKIKLHAFDWKHDESKKHQPIGLIADELEKIDPLFTIGGGYDENGSIRLKSIDVLYLVGYLVKAVQELSKK